MIGKAKSQLSLLDSVFNRRKKCSRSDDLLKQIDKFVDWKRLEAEVRVIYKKSNRGRPSIPIIYLLKCLFLQYLYGLSDPQLEDALIDRLSFQRFLGISFEEEIPDFTTIWRFRERLNKAKILDKIFDRIIEMLEERNLILRKGTIVDASIIRAARRPTKKEGAGNQKKQESPQQDKDAQFTKRGNKSYYGYKGHIGVDQGSGIIRRAIFTPANIHDSKELENLIIGDERSVFADKAYDSEERKRYFRARGIYYGILDKAHRNRGLSNSQKKNNKRKSRIRNAVERVFAHFKTHYRFRRVRYVTLARNEVQFKFICMIYNIRQGLALTTG